MAQPIISASGIQYGLIVNSDGSIKVNPLSDQLIQKIAYNSDGMTEYVGTAYPGTGTGSALWQIKRLFYSGTNVHAIYFADSNLNFDNVWDNRDTYTYG
jgi:hypothetical protein